MHITHNIKHVALYVGPLYKPFWSKKIDRVGREGQGRSGKVREGQGRSEYGPRNGLKSIGGDILGLTHLAHLTHLGNLESSFKAGWQKFCEYPKLSG